MRLAVMGFLAGVLVQPALAQMAPMPVRGITECAADLELGFSLAGRIEETLVREGQQVKKGQPMLKLEDDLERLDAKRRRLQAEDRSDLDAAIARLAIARTQFSAAESLYNESQGISREEVENRGLAVAISDAEVSRLSAQEAIEEVDYQTAAAVLAKRTLLAPAPGIVVELIKKTGESAQPNEPVVRLCDLSRVVFTANVPTEWAERLTANQAVALIVGGRQIPVGGRIRFVSPVADPGSGLRRVKVDLVNLPDGVRPGLSAVMTLP